MFELFYLTGVLCVLRHSGGFFSHFSYLFDVNEVEEKLRIGNFKCKYQLVFCGFEVLIVYDYEFWYSLAESSCLYTL